MVVSRSLHFLGGMLYNFPMLIGCITGPDFRSVKKQLARAKKARCDAVELRCDLISEEISSLSIPLPILDCGQMPTYHNFEETPEDLEAILATLPSGEPVKMATWANCCTDSLRMLDLVRRHKGRVAGMCMGAHGAITRILAPVFGSPLTFAAVGRGVFLAQMQAEELVYRYRHRQLSPKTQVFGLIGNPVSQSPGHVAHNRYFAQNRLDAVYVKMEVQEEELERFFSLVKRLGFKGLSVTAPFKEKLFRFLDSVEGKAGEIGAINTLTFGEQVVGSNTDADGALDVIEKRGPVHGKRMVILGAGGAAKAIGFEAERRGALVALCSRRFGNLTQIPPYDILVNTIPAAIDHDPLPKSLVMEVNFRAEGTPLMQKAKARDCELIFGEEMFAMQASYQFARWGQRPSL